MTLTNLKRRLGVIETMRPETERLVFDVTDDEAECQRLEALHPGCLIIHTQRSAAQTGHPDAGGAAVSVRAIENAS